LNKSGFATLKCLLGAFKSEFSILFYYTIEKAQRESGLKCTPRQQWQMKDLAIFRFTVLFQNLELSTMLVLNGLICVSIRITDDR
jgi:hypothetical protein